MNKLQLLLIYLTTLSACCFGADGPWPVHEEPELLGAPIEYKFEALPQFGTIRTQENKYLAWSGSYWPDTEGSIAARGTMFLERKDVVGFNYLGATLSELQSMSSQEISKLSPAEKLDIFSSRYDYPMLKEVYQRAHPEDKNWEGICHGWSLATLHHNEPMPTTWKNKEGISISFGASDLKALLSFYYAYFSNGETHFIGKRCFGNDRTNCKGINPAVFHLVVTNMLGIQRKGFVMDMSMGKQVWNQPIMGFESRVKDDDRRVSRKDRLQGLPDGLKFRPPCST